VTSGLNQENVDALLTARDLSNELDGFVPVTALGTLRNECLQHVLYERIVADFNFSVRSYGPLGGGTTNAAARKLLFNFYTKFSKVFLVFLLPLLQKVEFGGR